MDAGLQREESGGMAAVPYWIVGWSAILAYILFILTLFSFIRRRKRSVVFASIAGVGGYLVNLAIALVLDMETSPLGSQVLIFLSFVFPMFAVLSYQRLERRWGNPE